MKSHVKTYLKLVQAVYQDACATCFAEVSLRDLRTIRSRVRDQGVSFLTITLPNFCSDFEKGLEQGFVDRSLFLGFRKSGAIPAFMRGMLGRIFNKETGRINDEITYSPHVLALTVASVRQVCNAFKKLELACTPEREARAMGAFIANEQSFEMFTLSREDDDWFSNVSSVLWDSSWSDFCISSLVPRHGPGQTAERVSGNQKYTWRFWHDRIEPYFPLLDSAYSTSCGEIGVEVEELKKVSYVAREREQPVRVTPVPKTLKGPRIIAIEPCCMQYVQQAIRDYLYDKLEHAPFTAGHINFRDQEVNKRLALSSSADGQLATIDLSDASDRVPRSLALRMFRACPDLMDAIDACRSERAEMPSGEIIPLSKFASMGSALCFPVEAMYFYTICVVALLKEQNLSVSRANIKQVSRGIYVYGDDILVPTHTAKAVLDHLEKYNCKVNVRKSFYRGSFRESCGVDAFLGEPVTPVYFRKAPPQGRQQASEIVSWVATANLFAKKGYHRVSSLLFDFVEKITGPLPSVSETSQVLGRFYGWTAVDLRTRVNRRYQQLEVACWVPTPVYRTDPLDGYGALQKCLMRLSRLKETVVDFASALQRPFDHEQYLKFVAELDEKHLERTALYGRVALKRQWVPATTIAGLR